MIILPMNLIGPFKAKKPILVFLEFSIWMIGCYIIFNAHYYNPKAGLPNHGLCPEVPFMVAFVFLIFMWSVMVLLVSMALISLMGFCCYVTLTQIVESEKKMNSVTGIVIV